MPLTSPRLNKLSQLKWLGAAGIFVLAILLIEMNYLGSGLPQRWDVTRNRQHTLSPSTVDLIRQLNQEIKLTALTAGLPPKYLEDLFKEYERRSSGSIKTEIIDPLVDIGYAAQFGTVINSQENKVVAASGRERREIDFTQAPLTEEQLTNAILRVTRKPRQVYFLVGHGEYDIESSEDRGLSILVNLLAANQISSAKLFLGGRDSIPENSDLLIIAGPQTPLSADERRMIETCMLAGGDVLFLVEHVLVTAPDKPLSAEELARNPSLNDLLAGWGIKIGDDVVVDLTSHAGEDVGCPATRRYMPHKVLIKDLDYTFYIRPRSISMLSGRRETIKVVPFVLTASDEKSWAETNRSLEVKYEEGVDRPGPVPISMVAWEPKAPDEKSVTRLIVFTDTDFLSNAFIGQYSNGRMALNVVNWLTESDYQVFVDSKEIKVDRLDLTSRQKRIVAVILAAMPLLIVMVGAAVSLQRRR